MMNRDLFHRLYDDAAVFPPGDTPLCRAVRQHLDRASGPIADLVGPLVVAQRHLDELAELAGFGGAVVDIAVTTTSPSELPAIVRAAADIPAVRLVAVETALGHEIELAPAALGETALYVELPPGEAGLKAIPLLAGTPMRAKLRLGPTPEQCPAAEELAEVLVELALDRIRFKATAGLHHAVRTKEQHGFLNLMAAAGAAWSGPTPGALVPILQSTDPAELADRLAHGPDPRAMLLSIGTCSIEEPVDDLRALGLLR